MKSVSFLDALKNSRAYKLLKQDIANGVGHAYIINSSDDDIVAEFFTLIATTLYCEQSSGCQNCKGCKIVLNNNHPDIFILNEQREKIKVGEIKDFISNSNIVAFSNHKLFFIERADLMAPATQNKLLKTLEEPPSGVSIFLGVANLNFMLDTIKSRCRVINIDNFSSEVIYNSLLSFGLDEEVSRVASTCSDGKLSKAFKIAQSSEYLEIYKCAINLLSTLNRSKDIIKYDSLAIIQNKTQEFFNILSILLRDMLIIKTNPNLILSNHISKDLLALSERYSSDAISRIILKINEARKKLAYEANTIAVIDNFLFSVLEVRYKWQ